MRDSVLRLIAIFAALCVARSALADDSIVKSTLGNARSDTITVYWISLGCVGQVDNRSTVCHSAKLEPGQSATYTWQSGQVGHQVSASCKPQLQAWAATAELWIGGECQPTSPPSAEGRYIVINKVNALCLDPHGYDAPSGADVGLYLCDGGLDQVFVLTPEPAVSSSETSQSGSFSVAASISGYRPISDVKSGVCLDVAGYDGAVNANVGLYTCEDQDDQKWRILGPTDGQTTWRTLKNKKQTLCLEAEGDATSTANVRLATCDGSDRQQWTLVKVP